MSLILKEDFDRICDSDLPWDQLAGADIFLTGGTGLIGSLVTRALLYCSKKKGLGLKLVLLVRDAAKAVRIYGDHVEGLVLLEGDIRQPISYDGPVSHVIHCASVTTSKLMVGQPVETILTSVEGTQHVLELATAKQVHAAVYISSMEMYGSFADRQQPVTEKDLGYIDPLQVRSNYPESKRMCENLCVAYHSEYGIPVRIARLAQTFGAGILPGENRVFAQFARAAMSRQNIVLHTKGLSEGNYCYTADCVEGILRILLMGESGSAYNVVNEASHTTIFDMAQMVCRDVAGGQIQVVFDIPETNLYGYAQDTRLQLSGARLRSLGWNPKVGLREAYERMIAYLEEQEKGVPHV